MTTIPQWKRYPGNPILPSVPGTWMESQTANPDLLPYGSDYHLYFRGQRGGHDRIGLATVAQRDFDGVHWNVLPEPLIDVGGPGSWDESHVLDPATVLVGDTVYLYYSAVCPQCPRSICLATSRDGRRFEKYPLNPIVIGGGPEVVHDGSLFHLYYWREWKGGGGKTALPGGRRPKASVPGGGFQIHHAVSEDGFHFHEPSPAPCLPAGPAGSWDSYTVETPRIFREGGLYYLLYCGSDKWKDYPASTGLAVSRDLASWDKYKGNPVFSRGEKGDWDEGAVWFTTVERIRGRYWLWYEGYGGGNSRDKEYDSYLKGGKSQVGLATLDAPFFYVKP
jgi:predicted GH43/DUF377 family glycosyl hydrolase